MKTKKAKTIYLAAYTEAGKGFPHGGEWDTTKRAATTAAYAWDEDIIVLRAIIPPSEVARFRAAWRKRRAAGKVTT